MNTWKQITELAEDIIRNATSAGLTVATAESCTGGLIAGALTEIPGSSAVVDRGFVTYSNEAKEDMLGVQKETLKHFGAVSAQTAIAMADGALSKSNADICISVTGIAGPGGGSADKPVGTVHFALARRNHETQATACAFEDNGRDRIRSAAIVKALQLVSNAINSGS